MKIIRRLEQRFNVKFEGKTSKEAYDFIATYIKVAKIRALIDIITDDLPYDNF